MRLLYIAALTELYDHFIEEIELRKCTILIQQIKITKSCEKAYELYVLFLLKPLKLHIKMQFIIKSRFF